MSIFSGWRVHIAIVEIGRPGGGKDADVALHVHHRQQRPFSITWYMPSPARFPVR